MESNKKKKILRNKQKKIPTYTPLLRPTRLLISEKTFHLHGYYLLGTHA